MANPTDNYPGQDASLQTFGEYGEVITPSANKLARVYKYILCGGTGGSVTVEDKAGTSLVLYLNAGDVLKFRPTKITAAGATPLIGVFRAGD